MEAYDKAFRDYQNNILNPAPQKEKWEVERDRFVRRTVDEILSNNKKQY